MKFILLSRHVGGSSIPENDVDRHMKELGEWLGLLKGAVGMPTRGGKVVTRDGVTDYSGDLGGVILYEADDLEQAVALAKKSPGLKYGFAHEVFPEISLEEAARTH